MGYSLRQKLGAVAYDLPQYLWSLRPLSRSSWIRMRNRDERLITDERGVGVQCDWQWTSDLHVAKLFPRLGRTLMNRALRDWPIEFRGALPSQREKVQVSFIIGHRGTERVPHLLLTLQSIAAQRGSSVECIVVEQSEAPEVKGVVPDWARYVYTPLPYSDMSYCRAWAFNIGARVARGEVLVLHDSDMLVPRDYAAEISKRCAEGYEAVNLKRFIFFLSERHTEAIFGGGSLVSGSALDSVMQNAEGGGSIAITRAAYFTIGGFDESFVGWGGEDNEFWERAQTRRVWPYGYLPLVHLWHPAQPGKLEQRRSTAKLYESRSAIPVARRIAELRARTFPGTQTSPGDDTPSTLTKAAPDSVLPAPRP